MKKLIILIAILLAGCAATEKTIGPCIGQENLGFGLYRMWIDKNQDGEVDYYEVYQFDRDKGFEFVRREEVE